MKPTREEGMIQGGVPCDFCGADNPCGDVYSCAWWGSRQSYPAEPPRPEPSISELCDPHNWYALFDEADAEILRCYCGSRQTCDKAEIEKFREQEKNSP